MGTAYLAGMSFDALTTVYLGWISEKVTTRFGKVKLWYIIGSILLLPSYLFLYVNPPIINERINNDEPNSPFKHIDL